MPIKKILLVDDSKTELHLPVRPARASAASRCAPPRTAKRRCAASAEDKPDLILMDVVMPGQNGFQLTRAITRDPRSPTCR